MILLQIQKTLVEQYKKLRTQGVQMSQSTWKRCSVLILMLAYFPRPPSCSSSWIFNTGNKLPSLALCSYAARDICRGGEEEGALCSVHFRIHRLEGHSSLYICMHNNCITRENTLSCSQYHVLREANSNSLFVISKRLFWNQLQNFSLLRLKMLSLYWVGFSSSSPARSAWWGRDPI